MIHRPSDETELAQCNDSEEGETSEEPEETRGWDEREKITYSMTPDLDME